MAERVAQLTEWVQNHWSTTGSADDIPGELEVVSGDASFRRYFRARSGDSRFIAVDAPPDKEDSSPFVTIGQRWYAAGVRVPQIICADLQQGFMLLEDFGDALLLPHLQSSSSPTPYDQAMCTLLHLQQLDGAELPLYDDAVLKREMSLFDEWFLGRCLGLDLEDWSALLETLHQQLSERAQAQLQVPVHRDFHSRNLMPLADGDLGVIDYQDALFGPVTYDLVSLLRDSYIEWPQEQVEVWVEIYRQQLRSVGFEVPDQQAFLKDFYLMGMQRQLKVVGIFCRLWLRDGKSGYLKDIPRTFGYLQRAALRYPEFSQFSQALDDLLPMLRTHPLLGSHFEGGA
ncbi:MAG TPA: phosphotransferase [Marinobacterium sp.]|nr:phosphotransferase [Marinobacterium sp.]